MIFGSQRTGPAEGITGYVATGLNKRHILISCYLSIVDLVCQQMVRVQNTLAMDSCMKYWL